MHFGIRKRIRRILIWIWGTKIDERYWAKRYRKDQSDLIKEHYAKDRLYLLKKIKSDVFNSVLEIGSKGGRNLRMIAKSFPDVKLVGIDISSEAVKNGNELFKKEGLNNVTLFEGHADRLDFNDKSFDLVFSFAVLIYIDPKKIHKVLSEMIRVAKKRVLILEWHDPKLRKGKFINLWVYNYEKLLNCFKNQIRTFEITKIPNDEFKDTNWKKYGYYIDVKLRDRK